MTKDETLLVFTLGPSNPIVLIAIDPLPHHLTSVTFVLSKVDQLSMKKRNILATTF